MFIIFVTLAGAGSLAFAIAFFQMCGREKRWPSVIYLFELIGRWIHIKSERKDPLVTAAVLGWLAGLAGIVGTIATG